MDLCSAIAWSASFYPQPWLNWNRKSTLGLTIDFPLLNVVGFLCYSVSTCSFMYSPTIRSQYAARHPVSPEPTVQFNDVAFGVHAVVLVALTYSQFFPWLWRFKVSPRQKASKPVLGVVWGSILAVLVVTAIVLRRSGWQSQGPQDWAWIDVLYTLGYVKLICTFVKYIPQVILNFNRKSTVGWSIEQILCDITGGVLSLIQLVIDASFQGDWSGITGNSLKLGLSNISIAFDIIFIVQHFILYRGQDDLTIKEDDNLEQPLLDP
ncbi:PQ loop repeat-domain-containing protein [Exophiala viscosa]|uniref:PQ loop repeat-domain-containing protein n=1 Tax=Exophiala viscosa TaxID=2486360 RepID=UPI0021906487|nr:PQ loop repeat-domain-containing protein [Exophiala viscosa]